MLPKLRSKRIVLNKLGSAVHFSQINGMDISVTIFCLKVWGGSLGQLQQRRRPTSSHNWAPTVPTLLNIVATFRFLTIAGQSFKGLLPENLTLSLNGTAGRPPRVSPPRRPPPSLCSNCRKAVAPFGFCDVSIAIKAAQVGQ